MDTDLIAGRYRRERSLGRGAMGEVWLAHDTVLGRWVAVKQLRLDVIADGDPQAVERIAREARLAARLHHPNIVGVFDLVTVEGQPFVIMEFVEGESLAERLRRTGPLGLGEAVGVFAQVARGLAAAHRVGIVHRDIKPANVLITSSGEAKIADFGIARAQGDAALTETGHTIGTVAYMSPEIARGAEATPASDLWSLGATLYAALEGHSPHGGTGQVSAATLLVRLVTERVPPPRRAGAAEPVLAALFVDDPQRRPSADEIARQLAAMSAVAEAPTSVNLAKSDPGPDPTVTVAHPASDTADPTITGPSVAAWGQPAWGQPAWDRPAWDRPAAASAPLPQPAASRTAPGRTALAHAVLWGGLALFVVLITHWTFVQRAFYLDGDYTTGGLHLGSQAWPRTVFGVVEILPFLAASALVAGTGRARVSAAAAAVVAALAQYVFWFSLSSAAWVISSLCVLVLLVGWLAARERALPAFVALAPAALFAGLYYAPHGTGPWLRGLAVRADSGNRFLIALWTYAPFAVAGVSALLVPVVITALLPSAGAGADPALRPASGRPVGAFVLAAVTVATLAAGLIAQTGFDRRIDDASYASSDTDGGTGQSDPSSDPATSTATLDSSTASIAASDLFDAMESSTTATGCDGDITALDVQDYTIGQVDEQTSGDFQVTAAVTLTDGSQETVTLLVGTDAADTPCVRDDSLQESGSVPDPSATTDPSGQDPAVADPPADVPSVPSQDDEVPTDSALPDAPSNDAYPYDSPVTPTTDAQLVEYQPTGLDDAQTAAISGVMSFMVNVNRQHLAAAYDDTIQTLTHTIGKKQWSTGWLTTGFYQVAFGEPVQVSSTLVIVPSRWASRQDPQVQGGTKSNSTCDFWPQFQFLMKKVGDRWVWAQGNYENRADVRPYERIGSSGDPSLNPDQQRVDCS